MTITRKTPLALLLASTTALRRVAIVTGGTRGVGLGISQALAENDFDLLLTYNSDSAAAEKAVLELKNQFPICAIETVGGDVSLPETRAKAIFDKFDSAYAKTHCLGAVVHNAGQYVGVSSTNAAGIKATGPPPGFGDGSLLGADGGVDFTQMHYYQKMYGDAFVDLCERGLARFPEDGGSLVGISSPGCTLQFNPNLGYDMPGSSPSAPFTPSSRRVVMEYSRCAAVCRARGGEEGQRQRRDPGRHAGGRLGGARRHARHERQGDGRGRREPPRADGSDAREGRGGRRGLPLLAGRQRRDGRLAAGGQRRAPEGEVHVTLNECQQCTVVGFARFRRFRTSPRRPGAPSRPRPRARRRPPTPSSSRARRSRPRACWLVWTPSPPGGSWMVLVVVVLRAAAVVVSHIGVIPQPTQQRPRDVL